MHPLKNDALARRTAIQGCLTRTTLNGPLSAFLSVLAGACPHLLREAELYRYGTAEEDRRTEAPVDEHNHALAALRYLVSKLDAGRMARLAKGAGPSAAPAEEPDKPKKPADPWMDWRNEALWTRLF